MPTTAHQDLALSLYEPSASHLGAHQEQALCLFCGSGGPPMLHADSACASCGSPLAMPFTMDGQSAENKGRRGAMRRQRDHLAQMQLHSRASPVPVRWRDLSTTGLSVLAEQQVPVDQVIRITDEGIDVLAEVVDCRRHGQCFSVHARLLRARFAHSSGTFVHAKV